MVTARVTAKLAKTNGRLRPSHEEQRNQNGDQGDGERNDGEADLLGAFSARPASAAGLLRCNGKCFRP